MPETKSSLDIHTEVARLSAITTHDGTVIIIDPELGAVSGRSRFEAEQEIRRRKAALKGSEAA
ncbi:hypothetical protein A6U87_14905 [Rhizobium sp. AC44/96]|nr:hypothetical protein A6U87_14905 [Rhizobium sp. AC44/96]